MTPRQQSAYELARVSISVFAWLTVIGAAAYFWITILEPNSTRLDGAISVAVMFGVILWASIQYALSNALLDCVEHLVGIRNRIERVIDLQEKRLEQSRVDPGSTSHPQESSKEHQN